MSAAAPISARLIPGGAPSAGLRRYHGVAIRTESGSYDLALPPAMPAAEAATVAALLSAAPGMLAALREAYLSIECRPDTARVTAIVAAAIASAEAGR